MSSWLKNLIGRLAADKEAPPTALKIEEAAERVVMLHRLLEEGHQGAEFEETAWRTLRFLWDQALLLAELADGYPRKAGLPADVWMDGKELALMGSSLTEAFRSRGLTELEELATTVWVKATLQVQGHYPHIVGPAMLAAADCNERLGRDARAAELYEAVIEDFRRLVDEWESETDCPSEQDALALEALATALRRRMKLVGETATPSAHRKLLARIEAILARF